MMHGPINIRVTDVLNDLSAFVFRVEYSSLYMSSNENIGGVYSIKVNDMKLR